MARMPMTDMSAWPSLSLEGTLIAPAMVAAIDRQEGSEQTPESYGVRRGLSLRDEISTAFRVGQSHFDSFAKRENPSADVTRRFVRDFLRETFGFADLEAGGDIVTFLAGGRVPVVVVPPDEALDRRSRTLSVERSRSPAFALQDTLNERDEALWGLVTNGSQLRLMRDNASLTRPSYIEADLNQIFENEDAASFAALWLMIHRSRFGMLGAPAADCALERWREAGSREGEAARDRLAGQVQAALLVLGTGFLQANPELATRLSTGELALTDWFNELLRLVYRLIFLMVAEDRNLLHSPDAEPEARKLYADGYSMAMLRTQCVRRATWDRHHDRYEGIKIVFRGLAHGQQVLALPALAGLFGEEQLPNLSSARIRNAALMKALYGLAWLSDRTGMVPVNWRAMETEELGSVYESLLELQPQIGADGRSLAFASEAAEMKGNQRKTSGSYYTPDSLVQALLDAALDPVLDRTESEADDPAKALLELSVVDPACGSGHFLLGAARRIATRLARIRAEGTPSLADFRHALRDVARCCIYGVDRNPMAVELTKVALWIETVDPGLPLGFFDAQVRCGDALVGVFDLRVLQDGIPDAAYKPLTADDKETAKYYLRVNQDAKAGQGGFDFDNRRTRMPAMRPLAADFAGLRALPESTVEEINDKRTRLETLRASSTFNQLQTAADLYVAAFLLPKTGGVPEGPVARIVPTTDELWAAFAEYDAPYQMRTAVGIARQARAFHWPLEFPDVMQRGGFDLVLGNPPWDAMSPDYKEFFSVYDPTVRHLSPVDQKSVVNRLLSNPAISARWNKHCADLYASVHFIKSSGRYRLFAPGNLGKGDFNVYRMFVETALAATREGRVAAQFVPEGLYNGANATAIRRELFETFCLKSLAGFENSKGIWFPAIDTRMKFCLYVAWKGGQTDRFLASFRVNSTEGLQNVIVGRTLTIPVSIVEEFSPDALAVMEFADQSEIDVCAKMYARYPKFGAQVEGAPYRHYMREVDMGTDRGLFTDGDIGLPVYEGRMIDAFDYRTKGYVSGRGRSAVWEDMPFGSPRKRIRPQWRVRQESIPDKLADRVCRYRIGFGDVASPTNSRSLVAALIPKEVVSGHKVPTIEFAKGGAKDLLLWLGIANSFAMDFLVRKKVSLTMSYTIMDSLPFPRDFEQTKAADEIAQRVCALCAVGPEMDAFRKMGVEANILRSVDDVVEDPDRRAALAAEVDTLVAREVFGLTKDEMLYILDPANILGADCGIETFKALRNRELREFGEFRTQRLIMEAWEKTEAKEAQQTMLLAKTPAGDLAVPVELPPLDVLQDGAWSWPADIPPSSRLRYVAQYTLWLVDPAEDGKRVRFLIACLAEPALLTPWLSSSERAHWTRLVGPEAQPVTGVTRLRPQINEVWRSMFQTLLSSGQLEERADGGWARGRDFEPAGLRVESADAQRVTFAMRVIRNLATESLTAAIAPEDNVIWKRFGGGTAA